MKSPFEFAIASLALGLAFSSALAAQNAPPPTQNRNAAAPQDAAKNTNDDPGGPAPVHDLTGSWVGPNEAGLSNRIPPMTPEGQAKLKLNVPDPFSATSNDPWKTCDPFGMPRIVNNQIAQIAFAQLPGRIAILEYFARTWREVWMDGRQLPKNVGHKGGPSTMYLGYSVGHWEGDNTLVVDTVGMDERTWVDRRGYPHSVDAHVIERYTRTDHNHLELTETIDDPAYYTQPFVIAKNAYRWVRGQENSGVAPFSNEWLCLPSEAIEYMKIVGNAADEDAVTGNKKP